MTGDGSASARRFLGPGLLLVLLTAVVSGVSTYLNAFAVQGTSSDAFVTVRNVSVAIMIAPWALAAGRSGFSRLSRSDLLKLVTIGLVGGAVPFLLFFHGLQMASQAHGGLTASFLYRTLFLMAGVLGVLWLRERFRWWMALGAGLLLGGNYLLMSLSSPVWSDGSLYVLAATGMWAVEYAMSKRMLTTLSAGTVALGRMGFGAVFLVGFLALSGQMAQVGSFSVSQWSWVGISALMLALFVTTWYSGLKHVDLSVATSVLVLGFPVTWLLSVLLQSARPTEMVALGALAVVLGVVLMVGLALWREMAGWLAQSLRRGTRPLRRERES